MPKQPFTKDDLKAAMERCEKATPGPWVVGGTDNINSVAPKFADVGGLWIATFGGACLDDGMFIANARTDLPRALATLEEVRESLSAIREGIDEIGKMCQGLDESTNEFDLWMTICNIRVIAATEQTLRAAEEG